MTNEQLAIELARRLFKVGDGPNPCRRIQFMAGDYNSKETGQGGFCEEALARFFRDELSKLRSSANGGEQR